MPAIQKRPPVHIGSLEAEGPALEPAVPSGDTQATAEVSPHAQQPAAEASPALSHWADDAVEEDTSSAPLASPAHTPPGGSPLSHWAEPGGVSGNPLAGKKFYLDPQSKARRQAQAWRSSRPDDAAQMEKIADSPQAAWLTGGAQNVEGDVRNRMAAAKAQGTMPVFVAYNIPNRDVGQHSAGGGEDAAQYKAWVDKIAAAIKGDPAVVILEPDALAQADKLTPAQREERFAMMRQAVETLKKAGASVYLDAGNPEWKKPPEMAQSLKSAGIAGADGFALNVSNFFTTESNIAYGTALSAQLGGKHFVVDTSRNGLGPTPDRQWCNPAGRALGHEPTTATGNPLVDAFMWIKNPGESDGTDNGGLRAGEFMPDYALGLAKREPANVNAPPATPTSTTTATAPAPSTHPLLRLNIQPLPPR